MFFDFSVYWSLDKHKIVQKTWLRMEVSLYSAPMEDNGHCMPSNNIILTTNLFSDFILGAQDCDAAIRGVPCCNNCECSNVSYGYISERRSAFCVNLVTLLQSFSFPLIIKASLLISLYLCRRKFEMESCHANTFLCDVWHLPAFSPVVGHHDPCARGTGQKSIFRKFDYFFLSLFSFFSFFKLKFSTYMNRKTHLDVWKIV